MLCSIVITLYKRPALVTRAVASAFAFGHACGQPFEVILVDDGSFDNGLSSLQDNFSAEFEAGSLRLMAHIKNQGVSAAKNTGFLAAQGKWVCFLDSDDELLPENAHHFTEAAKTFAQNPILFFKCIDQSGNWVGKPFDKPFELGIKRYFTADYGEVLTMIRRDIDFKMPYDDDLRGFEGLGCLRIIRRHGPGILIPSALRRYYTAHEGRLSGKKALLTRSASLARGHARTLREFSSELSPQIKARLIIKILGYCAISVSARLFTH